MDKQIINGDLQALLSPQKYFSAAQNYPEESRFESLYGKSRPIDYSRMPYDCGVDLAGVQETTDQHHQLVNKLISIPELSPPLSELRQRLAARYPASDYPDINQIVSAGTLLLRQASSQQIPHVVSHGTDRTKTSCIGTEYSEDEIARHHNLMPDWVTYVSERKLGWRGIGGSEDISFRLTGCNLVYDPRYMDKLGLYTNGFSTFRPYASRALLAIIQSTHSSVGTLAS